mgnify:CR=1 FL=1
MNLQIGLSKVQPGSLIGKMIDESSGGGGFCHAFLYIPDLWCCYEAHAKFGVRFNARNVGSDEVLLDIPGLTDEKALNILRECVRHDGKDYDFRGIFAFKTPLIKHSVNDFFCSELLITVLQAAGYYTGINPSAITPNAIAKMKIE